MAKRKPPSQRPELKMDETALALARLREEQANKSKDAVEEARCASRPAPVARPAVRRQPRPPQGARRRTGADVQEAEVDLSSEQAGGGPNVRTVSGGVQPPVFVA